MSTVSSVPNDLLYIVRLSHLVYHIQYTYAHFEYNSYVLSTGECLSCFSSRNTSWHRATHEQSPQEGSLPFG